MPKTISGDLLVKRRSSANLAFNFPNWQPDKDYLANDRFMVNNEEFFVIADHHSPAIFDPEQIELRGPSLNLRLPPAIDQAAIIALVNPKDYSLILDKNSLITYEFYFDAKAGDFTDVNATGFWINKELKITKEGIKPNFFLNRANVGLNPYFSNAFEPPYNGNIATQLTNSEIAGGTVTLNAAETIKSVVAPIGGRAFISKSFPLSLPGLLQTENDEVTMSFDISNLVTDSSSRSPGMNVIGGLEFVDGQPPKFTTNGRYAVRLKLSQNASAFPIIRIGVGSFGGATAPGSFDLSNLQIENTTLLNNVHHGYRSALTIETHAPANTIDADSKEVVNVGAQYQTELNKNYSTLIIGDSYATDSNDYGNYLLVNEGIFVRQNGVGGHKLAGDIEARLPALLAEPTAAGVHQVIIQGGINDVFQNSNVPTMKAALSNLIDMIITSGRSPVLTTVPTTATIHNNATQASTLKEWNIYIRSFARKFNFKVIDLHALTTDTNLQGRIKAEYVPGTYTGDYIFTGDTNHIKTEINKLIIAPYVASILRAPSTSISLTALDIDHETIYMNDMGKLAVNTKTATATIYDNAKEWIPGYSYKANEIFHYTPTQTTAVTLNGIELTQGIKYFGTYPVDTTSNSTLTLAEILLIENVNPSSTEGGLKQQGNLTAAITEQGIYTAIAATPSTLYAATGSQDRVIILSTLAGTEIKVQAGESLDSSVDSTYTSLGADEVIEFIDSGIGNWTRKPSLSTSPITDAEKEIAIADGAELLHQSGVINRLTDAGTHTRPGGMVASDVLSVSVSPGESSSITGIGVIANTGTDLLFKSYLLSSVTPDVWELYSSGGTNNNVPLDFTLAGSSTQSINDFLALKGNEQMLWSDDSSGTINDAVVVRIDDIIDALSDIKIVVDADALFDLTQEWDANYAGKKAYQLDIKKYHTWDGFAFTEDTQLRLAPVANKAAIIAIANPSDFSIILDNETLISYEFLLGATEGDFADVNATGFWVTKENQYKNTGVKPSYVVNIVDQGTNPNTVLFDKDYSVGIDSQTTKLTTNTGSIVTNAANTINSHTASLGDRCFSSVNLTNKFENDTDELTVSFKIANLVTTGIAGKSPSLSGIGGLVFSAGTPPLFTVDGRYAIKVTKASPTDLPIMRIGFIHFTGSGATESFDLSEIQIENTTAFDAGIHSPYAQFNALNTNLPANTIDPVTALEVSVLGAPISAASKCSSVAIISDSYATDANDYGNFMKKFNGIYVSMKGTGGHKLNVDIEGEIVSLLASPSVVGVQSVLIQGGINDIFQNSDFPTMKAALGRIIGLITAAGKSPVLTTVPSTASIQVVPAKLAVHTKWNLYIKSLSAQQNYVLVDLHALVTDKNLQGRIDQSLTTGTYTGDYTFTGDTNHISSEKNKDLVAPFVTKALTACSSNRSLTSADVDHSTLTINEFGKLSAIPVEATSTQAGDPLAIRQLIHSQSIIQAINVNATASFTYTGVFATGDVLSFEITELTGTKRPWPTAELRINTAQTTYYIWNHSSALISITIDFTTNLVSVTAGGRAIIIEVIQVHRDTLAQVPSIIVDTTGMSAGDTFKFDGTQLVKKEFGPSFSLQTTGSVATSFVAVRDGVFQVMMSGAGFGNAIGIANLNYVAKEDGVQIQLRQVKLFHSTAGIHATYPSVMFEIDVTTGKTYLFNSGAALNTGIDANDNLFISISHVR